MRSPSPPGKQIRIKKAIFLFGVLLFMSALSVAQSRYTLTNSPSFTINNYVVLPDDHYSLSRVTSDTALQFKPDSLSPAASDYYWAKIIIYNPYPNNESYRISLSLPLNYTLYQYNPGLKQWQASAGGLNSANGQRKPGVLPCVLQKAATNTLYLKISVIDLKAHNYTVRPIIKMEKEVTFVADEQFQTLSHLLCCIVLFSFSGYNLYIYFQLKDKAYLYYVVVQIGALIYLTSNKLFFNVLIPSGIYNLGVVSGNRVEYFNLNYLFMHISVVIIFCGFIQFTRSYLRTKEVLPTYDKVLKILSYGYMVLEAVPSLINITRLYFINIIPESNAFILVIVFTCMVAGGVAYKRNVREAAHFLAANFLPMIFTASVSVYILLYSVSATLLPEIAILSQILTFAVALVARIKIVNEDLKAKAIEAIQLENSITITEYKRLLVEEENKNITLTMQLEKEKNEQLQQRLEENQRELVGNSLYIHQKNRLLADLKTQMQDMDTLYPDTKPEALRSMQSSLNGGQLLDVDWDKFKMHFEQVHPSFFNKLQVAHPSLTRYELRLYAYFHINLSTKEIAALLNIAPASVRQAKARLNKKMKL
jgi:hypothetical protein